MSMFTLSVRLGPTVYGSQSSAQSADDHTTGAAEVTVTVRLLSTAANQTTSETTSHSRLPLTHIHTQSQAANSTTLFHTISHARHGYAE